MTAPAAPARRGFHLPHPFALLFGCVLLAALLTHVLPAGAYERRDDPVSGRSIAVAGTYHAVEAAPVGAFAALAAIPRGVVAAADILVLVFLSGGGFVVVERTGALRYLMAGLLRRIARRPELAIPVAGLAFAAGGALIQMSEELVAFAPLLLLLCRTLGFPPLVAAAVSIGTASIGAAFSPVDPFMVGIAQKVAQLPVGSGGGFRSAFLAVAVGWWLWSLARYARRHAAAPEAADAAAAPGAAGRHLLVLLVVLATFVLFVLGAQRWGWDFEQLAACFLLMGIVGGAIGGLGVQGTAEGFTQGFRDMAFSALLIGVARAISIVLSDGHVIDTIVHGIVAPLQRLPVSVAAFGMAAAHMAIHVPVPSSSGHAVLTMPILVPVADLLGLSRQVAVLAYQYGTGASELLTPTNGALMAMLAACGVRYEDWLRFLLPRLLALLAIAASAIALGLATGLR